MFSSAGRLGNRQGQSIVEYLVVIAVILGALMLLGGPTGLLKGKVQDLGNNAANGIGKAATAINNNVTSAEQ